MDMPLYMVCVLSLLLLMAAWQDCQIYRIQNALVISGALLGVVLNGLLPTGINVYASLLGWGVGLLLLLPLYWVRAMGGGDVKLMAMVGAFLGPQATLTALLYILVTGGFLAIAVALYRGVLKKLFYRVLFMLHHWMMTLLLRQSKNNTQSKEAIALSAASDATADSTDHPKLADARLPYGIAIAVGTAAYIAVHRTYLF